MLKDGYKNTEIGVIPVEWEVVSFKKFFSSVGAQRYQVQKSNYLKNGTYPIVDQGQKFIVGYSDEEDKVYKNTNGVIVFGDHTRIIKFIDFDFVVGADGTQLLKSIDGINQKFSYYILSNKKLTHLGYSRHFKLVKEMKFPLPPLKEQEKITSILSTVDAKIDAISSQIKKAQTLKKGLLQKLLSEGIGHSEFKDSEIGVIPVEWEVVKLDDLGRIITGSTPKTANQDFYLNGIRLWASPSDLGKSKEVKTTNTKLSNLGFEQIRVLEKRSILITCIGSTIGKIGMAYEEMSSNQQINAITCNKENNPDFYYYVLFKIKDKIKKLAGTHAVPMLNKTDFSQIKVIQPPLKEQKQIASILAFTDEKIEVLRTKKEKYQTLKKGLLQKLLSGEIRV